MHWRPSLSKSIAASLLLAASSAAHAQPRPWRDAPPSWATPEDVANERQLRNLCMFVADRTPASDDAPGFRYQWEVRLARVARADGPVDTPEESARLQAAWRRFQQHGMLVCNSLQFDVVNGSVLKLAVSTLDEPFVAFAARHQLGLDHVDVSDGRTALDDVRDRIQRAPGAEVAATLRRLQEVMRRAGARYRDEVE